MDMTAIRRNLLLSIFGGEPAMIGEISKYEKHEITLDSAADHISFYHSLGVIPKLITVSANEESAAYDSGFIRSAVYNQLIGGAWYKNLANGNLLCAGLIHVEKAGSANASFTINSSSIYLRQVSNNGKWAATTYKVELYA